MNLDKVFTICPYLAGSPDGVICRVTAKLIIDSKGLDPEYCTSRHFEICRNYISELEEIDIVSLINNAF